PAIGLVLLSCLADNPRERPDAVTAARRIEEAVAAEAERQALMGESAKTVSQFTEGGVIDDRWEIRESLGVGGFARTWRAWDRVTGHCPSPAEALPRRRLSILGTLPESLPLAGVSEDGRLR
ncbi:MAG: hypothetical protein ACRDNW_15445, partial [Trebonia sp.]